ncbi:SufD family Fe-S cluster assembly protein [Konateibacter massiliensis]|uniref:SufD family Fe-S cluster assembly protein n=1 Tax=Konateibacter massiliensis TaxID=2002841 RepID=UPI000C152F7D|nr:SufD family Fe-S cluster assembly protein [Konateibacter massiliensis]
MTTKINKYKYEIERMQVKTWSWLKVNTANLGLYADEEKGLKDVSIEASDAIEISHDISGAAFPKDASKEFMNEEMEKFLEENRNVCYYIRIPDHHKEKEPIRITFEFDKNTNVFAEDLVIEAGEQSESSILIQYVSKDGSEGYHSGRTRVLVQQNASLKLMKTQLLNDNTEHNDIFGGTVAENGKLSVLQAEMGSKGAVASWNVLLLGEQSEADVDVVYVGEKEKKLDFSSRVEFQAPKSVSNVRVRGVLLGHSKKIFRDTLDFISGSRGAKGREEEEVLMLSKNARNISVPLMFCGEDDVQGEHAASSGRPDESTLFYLMSRGLSEADSKKLLAESKFAAILDNLSDDALREEILERLRTSIEEGGNES